VTLSRDIRELGLLKTPDGYRQLTPFAAGPESLEAGRRVVAGCSPGAEPDRAATAPGNANALAVAIDDKEDCRKWWAPSPATTP
jgi:transcriptional regulator of arginine metabolism